MLRARNLEVVYDDVMLVLRGVSLDVPAGKIVALLGANGAGKTTLLRALSGLLDVHDGEITKGAVTPRRRARSTASRPAPIVRRGVSQVMEGRRIFAELTVEENLRVGAHTARAAMRGTSTASSTCSRCSPSAGAETAGYLSGGEQQMLAMGRALMADPRYLLLDEPSLGLAPTLVEQIRDLIVEINQAGHRRAAGRAERDDGAVDRRPRLRPGDRQGRARQAGGRAARRRGHPRVLPRPAARRGRRAKSFRDVKHYKRRKRWLS